MAQTKLLDSFTFHPEEVHEIGEKVQESVCESSVPVDEYGFHLGSFKITIEWIPPEDE